MIAIHWLRNSGTEILVHTIVHPQTKNPLSELTSFSIGDAIQVGKIASTADAYARVSTVTKCIVLLNRHTTWTWIDYDAVTWPLTNDRHMDSIPHVHLL